MPLACRCVLLLLLASVITACGPQTTTPDGAAGPTTTAPAYPAEIHAGLDRYEAVARSLSTRLGQSADPDTLKRDAQELLDLSAVITPAFVQRHPACGKYLEAALQVRTRWTTMDAETAEHDYHADGALPAQGTPAACYHMKDLIVHPATVLILLSQPVPDLAKAKHEIDEVVAHVSVVRAG